MNNKLEKLQNQREKLQKRSEKLSKVASRELADYEVGEFIPFFLTRAFAMGAQEALEAINDRAIESPCKTGVAKAVHKGACYAFAGATAAFFAVGIAPFAVLEAPVAAVGCGIQGLKDLDASVYNARIVKAEERLGRVNNKINDIDLQIAELSQQRA